MNYSFCFAFISKRFPFVGLVLAAIVGILIEEFFQWPSWSLILGVFATFGGWIFLRRWRLPICFLFITFFFGALHAWQWEEAPARRLALLINQSTSNVLVKGVVASEVKRAGKNHLIFFVKVEQLEWGSTMLTPHVKMLVHWEGVAPNYGDIVLLRAAAQTPSLPKNPGEFNKTAWLARQEIFTELKMDPSEPGTILSSGHGLFLKHWAIAWRERAEKLLESGIENLSSQSTDTANCYVAPVLASSSINHTLSRCAPSTPYTSSASATLEAGSPGDQTVVSIIKGIVLGVKENEALFDDFKLTGTMHLFAVSGLHVGMVVMILCFFLKLLRLSMRAAVPVTLLFLFAYVMVTGCHIGSLRAGVMAAIVLIGFLLERRPQVLNNLAAAAFLLLAFDTNLFFSMGWQFSFSVVLAIVLLTPLLEEHGKKYFTLDPFLPKSLITSSQKRWQHFRKHLTQLVAVSIAAWVGALLPTAYYFHQISFSALGANIIAVPLGFLIMLTALLSISTGLIIPAGATIFNNANWLFAKILICVIHVFTLLPWSSCLLTLPTFSQAQLTLLALPASQASVLRSEGKTWLFNTGRGFDVKKTVIPFLETSGIKQLDGILLTDEEASFAGGASLLLDQFPYAVLIAPSDHGHSYLFQRLAKKYRAAHPDVASLERRERIDFSSNCRGEILAPAESAAVALKLHLPNTTLLFLPNLNIAWWLLNNVPPETLRADILVFPPKKMNLLQQQPLLDAVHPKFLILPQSSWHGAAVLEGAEKEMLQQRGIVLFSQDQTGAITLRSDQSQMLNGLQADQVKAFFQCK